MFLMRRLAKPIPRKQEQLDIYIKKILHAFPVYLKCKTFELFIPHMRNSCCAPIKASHCTKCMQITNECSRGHIVIERFRCMERVSCKISFDHFHIGKSLTSRIHLHL